MNTKKIGIAMSGGVDSTACALLLLQHHDVHGFFMRLAGPDLDKQEQRARAVANQLGVDLQVIDLSHEFSTTILHYFTTTYQQGLTPNPCMICNHTIKFGIFMDAILASGMDAMATGHYARIEKDGDTYQLYKGSDKTKDQSYFLARLDHYQLSRSLFPLGEHQKEEAYQLVEEHGFTDFRGQESQDICFLGSTPVGQFLSERIPQAEQAGRIVTREGQDLGVHQGLFHYTIGQRRGLGIADISPWYVTALDPETNSVIIGKEEDLYRDRLLIHQPHWLQTPDEGQTYQVKIRYRHQGADASIKRIDDRLWEIHFETPQRAVTPGQFAVIYDNDKVLGCGEIE
ncbi:MAG: tRNA 2-thiouridine(34) synthase MnmA [Proteobacteria bacterium]|nr:tRNA 2-thiouridine(34) synthase MnmA [Desulfocapsa sp.]MBU3946533.1 tRNA 2-thiouridine(34) synthase MnmA [Pseudomonadota bacterium]MCG2745323.1 tRNA 2-thiouridine(34) synthase MnmA [Desulfobacteraceae bacterium]MBU3984516.1 tRNA 2-thiouridine(34) synthase MnmA [Pseudomonadota bacterium]MBU4028413.1 tRNA 2-thiouridine(34) synthase MnmA [Pseudomonadota bacterium]